MAGHRRRETKRTHEAGNRPGYGGFTCLPRQALGERNSMSGRIYSLWGGALRNVTGMLKFRGETSAALFDSILSESARRARTADILICPPTGGPRQQALEKDRSCVTRTLRIFVPPQAINTRQRDSGRPRPQVQEESGAQEVAFTLCSPAPPYPHRVRLHSGPLTSSTL